MARPAFLPPVAASGRAQAHRPRFSRRRPTPSTYGIKTIRGGSRVIARPESPPIATGSHSRARAVLRAGLQGEHAITQGTSGRKPWRTELTRALRGIPHKPPGAWGAGVSRSRQVLGSPGVIRSTKSAEGRPGPRVNLATKAGPIALRWPIEC